MDKMPVRELDKPGVRSAAEVHEAAELLQDLGLEQLRDIPVLHEGTRLEQGATYVDLRDPQRKPFTARGDMFSSRGSLTVPKAGVPHPTWNRIVGEHDPGRIF